MLFVFAFPTEVACKWHRDRAGSRPAEELIPSMITSKVCKSADTLMSSFAAPQSITGAVLLERQAWLVSEAPVWNEECIVRNLTEARAVAVAVEVLPVKH